MVQGFRQTTIEPLQQQPPAARASRCLQIRRPVSDEPGFAEIDVKKFCRGKNQTGGGLSAKAPFIGCVRAVKCCKQFPTVFLDGMAHDLVNVPEVAPGNDPPSQARLVGDENGMNPQFPEKAEGPEALVMEPELSGCFHEIWSIQVQDAIAIEQHKTAPSGPGGIQPDLHGMHLLSGVFPSSNAGGKRPLPGLGTKPVRIRPLERAGDTEASGFPRFRACRTQRKQVSCLLTCVTYG